MRVQIEARDVLITQRSLTTVVTCNPYVKIRIKGKYYGLSYLSLKVNQLSYEMLRLQENGFL